MKLQIPYLVLSVGQACNLRCKNCGNFSPYALPEMRKYPVESIIADFEALLKGGVEIDLLQIQGGEPLVYKDLNKLVAYFRASGAVNRICIATNGLIVPSDRLLYICAVFGVYFRISNYPQNRNTLPAFIEKTRNFNVSVVGYDFAGRGGFWYECGGLDTPREDNDAIVAARFNNCDFKGCLTLENGELYPPHFETACRYCYGTKWARHVPAAEQL